MKKLELLQVGIDILNSSALNSEMAAQGLKVWETMFTLSTDINSLCEFSVFIWSLMFSFSMAFYIELTILLMSYYFPWQTPR